jgi:ATP-dependent exoDNAse (exonuclease V) beta subunit
MTERQAAGGLPGGALVADGVGDAALASRRARLDADTLARRRALLPESFIVEAPAGAGKTELLTQRYLALLAGVSDPEEIIAITFTNKAAAEMRQRVLASLQRAASGERPDEPHRAVTFDLASRALSRSQARNWRLIEQPSRLRMLTIDALCAQLARQMPLLSRIGGQPAIADDAAALYEEAARLAVEQLEGADPQLAAGVAASLAQVDNHAARLVRRSRGGQVLSAGAPHARHAARPSCPI